MTSSQPDARVRASFDKQDYMQTLGAVLESVAPGRVVIALAHRRELTQQHGFIHAGAVASVLDSACGYAAYSLMPEGAGVLTVEYKINLVAPAGTGRLIATGSVVRAGRTITACRGEAVVRDGDTETVVAIMQATVMTIVGRDRVRG